ncbi:uncharacterized protein METZ01_LOCUS241857 [marine metagenome]|uniref:Uncharacterized protein n=1 Tax=marine metagenome TaxID=408172 RepID=A0A382HQU1_9ZZZZ
MKIKIISLFILAFGFSQSKINEVTEGKERLLILPADKEKRAQSIRVNHYRANLIRISQSQKI